MEESHAPMQLLRWKIPRPMTPYQSILVYNISVALWRTDSCSRFYDGWGSTSSSSWSTATSELPVFVRYCNCVCIPLRWCHMQLWTNNGHKASPFKHSKNKCWDAFKFWLISLHHYSPILLSIYYDNNKTPKNNTKWTETLHRSVILSKKHKRHGSSLPSC